VNSEDGKWIVMGAAKQAGDGFWRDSGHSAHYAENQRPEKPKSFPQHRDR
jgi:hypothetical protein